MRFATVQVGGKAHLGLLDGEHVFLFAPLARLAARGRIRGRGASPVPDDLLAFIEHGSLAQARAALALGRSLLKAGKARDVILPASKVRFLAPIPRPRKNIVCLGRNYAEHAKESGGQVPTVPIFFTKPPTCVVGPGAAVVHHPVTEKLDYEVELAAIIGRRGRDIPESRALAHVFGYTIMNDVTARDLQRRHEQWFKGKSLDTFAPMGPVVAHRSAIRDPQNLVLRLRVNGEQRQHASTRGMVFPVARIISVLSAGMTLEPGDIIATGTPEGVGMGMNPPVWLKPGDVMEAEIEGIGVLRNPIVAP
ncbi:MAG: fumarylacetoacetate hydrolase family protein [Armatimonadota bacterium]|nr:fumarylacetoacetate hydrolase family protein [Armatimonadota bacterium]